MDDGGGALNINADSFAFSVASALGCTNLLFLSDVPGVLKDAEVIDSLNAEEAVAAIADGTISGGMIPKVQSSLEALRQGVRTVTITDYRRTGDLHHALDGKKGTALHASGGDTTEPKEE
jgi:acetylglutamate kinase